MSLHTVSSKRDRVYQRKFDHDLARQMRAEGMSYQAIADQLGVSQQAVRRVCDPQVAATMNAAALRNLERRRRPCLGGCGRLVWMHRKTATGYCYRCFQSLRDQDRPDVRPTELQCYRCHAWKPDADFPPARGRAQQAARRGHHIRCRSCENAIRADHRRRKPEITAETERRHYIQKRRKAMTGYVVLRPAENGYEEVGRVEAVSPTHAIESVVSEPGQYCAVKQSALKLLRVGQVQSFRVLPDAEAVRAVA